MNGNWDNFKYIPDRLIIGFEILYGLPSNTNIKIAPPPEYVPKKETKPRRSCRRSLKLQILLLRGWMRYLKWASKIILVIRLNQLDQQ